MSKTLRITGFAKYTTFVGTLDAAKWKPTTMMGKRLINQILPCLFFGLSEMHACNHQVDVICCFDIQASKAAWVAKLCSNSWCTSFGIETCVNDHPGRRILSANQTN